MGIWERSSVPYHSRYEGISDAQSMPVILSDMFGDPNIGVFCFTNETVTILPAGISSQKVASFREALGAEVVAVGIADSRLVGVYVAGNSNSIIVPQITTEEEVKLLEKAGVEVLVLNEKKTALGNLILSNDYGALVDPRLKATVFSAVEEALKVPVRTGTIGGLPHVGALATASNKGVLANPMIGESEKKKLADALGVPVTAGTVNSGVPYPKSGILVNSKGAVVGSRTLGSELLTLSTVFQMD